MSLCAEGVAGFLCFALFFGATRGYGAGVRRGVCTGDWVKIAVLFFGGGRGLFLFARRDNCGDYTMDEIYRKNLMLFAGTCV